MSGFVRVPFATCAAVVVAVSVIWTPALFVIGQTTGAAAIMQLGAYGWAIGAALLGIAFAGPYIARSAASLFIRLRSGPAALIARPA
jgi:hypothetical protein